MSTLLTNYYIAGSIDLSAVFPQFEVKENIFYAAGSYDGDKFTDFTINDPLKVSNYFVIPQFVSRNSTDSLNISNNTYPLIVTAKTSSGFRIYVRFSAILTLTEETNISCLIIYYNPDTQTTPVKYPADVNIGTSAGSIANNFPNYTYYNATTSTDQIQVNGLFNFTSKNNTSLIYYTFGSFQADGSIGNLSTDLNQFMFPTVATNRTVNSFNFAVNLGPNTNQLSFIVNVLVLFNEFDINIRNYTPQFTANGKLFQNLFPRCLVYEIPINNNASQIDGAILFSYDPLNPISIPTNQYHVFTSFSYNYWTSAPGGIYSVFPASSAARNLVIEKLTTGFVVSFIKSTGDIWDGKIICLVVFTTISN